MIPEYYACVEADGSFAVRQQRLRDLHNVGRSHPHDVIALAITETGLRSIVEAVGIEGVDFSGLRPAPHSA